MRRLLRVLRDGSVLPAILVALIVVSGIVTVFTFSTGLYNYDLWDYIEGVFWADATLKAGAPVHPAYVYYYILPFGSNLIMAPFVRLFGTTFLANQAGMLVFFLIFLAAAFHLGSALFPKDRGGILLFVSFLSLFVYTYAGSNLLHHLLAYGIGFAALLGELACVVEISAGKHVRRDLLLLPLWAFWSAANGFSAVFSSLPVMAALFLLRSGKRALLRRETLRPLLVTAAATAAGLLVFMRFDASALTQGTLARRLMLDAPSEVAVNLTQDLVKDYLRLFFYNPNGTPLVGGKGVFMLIKLLFAGLTAALPLWLGRRRKAGAWQAEECDSLTELAALFVMAVCLGQYLLTVTSIIRYLFNALLSVFLIGALRFTRYVRKTKRLSAVAGLAALIILFTSVRTFQTYPEGVEKRAPFEQVRDAILAENIDRGYVCSRRWKVLDLLSGGACYNTTVRIEPAGERLEIERDRIYLYELEKPEGIDRFYVVAYDDQIDENERLFSGWIKRTEVADAGASVLFYDLSEWDRLFGTECT